MGVYEEDTYPYLRQVGDLIREAYYREVPVLGICLGGQLIVKALGASVSKNQVPEIGWYLLRLTAEGKKSRLFAGLPDEFQVIQWHNDAFALPNGARLLATGETCRNQAFSVGNSMFALQFHPEVIAEMIGEWAALYSDELAEVGGENMAGSLVAAALARQEEHKKIFDQILRNWLDILGLPAPVRY